MIKPYLRSFKPYPPGKPVEELRRELGIEGPIIKLASNENPFGPPKKALEALSKAAETLNRYPDPSAYELRRALAQKFGVKESEIVVGNGSNEVLDLLVKACLSPGEEALMSDPSFLMYEKFVTAAGGKIKKIPLKNGKHDLEGYLSLVSEKTRLIFLDHPHNPTGSILTHKVFLAWHRKLPEGVVVVLDEAYGEFVNDPARVRPLFFKDQRPPVVLLRTFSKAYGLAGLRIGYGIMEEELASVLNAIRQPFNVNTLAQEAARAALEDEDYLRFVLEKTWEERKRLTRAFQEMGLQPFPSQANFILVDLGREARPVYEALLRRGVIVRSMEAYGFPTCLRVSIGTPQENAIFLKKLREVLGGL